MLVKTPITDADSIRALACRALAGLARSEKVRQIISQLPMFTEGQIQALMKDPILQEKRQEHVTFQKHALDLLECVSGKTKPTGSEYEISLVSLHRASVFFYIFIWTISKLYKIIFVFHFQTFIDFVFEYFRQTSLLKQEYSTTINNCTNLSISIWCLRAWRKLLLPYKGKRV